MDRPIVYTQEQGRDVDFLFGMRAAMVGLGKLAETVLGDSTQVYGLACTPTSPAGLTVNIAPGQIYSLEDVDATAYGSLAADITDTVIKQGLSLATVNLSCPAPTTAGYSINYLIEATYQDSDTANVVLPYFNSANPSKPLSGQNNTGAAQPTERQGVCSVTVKAGVAAATGTQTTPAPDAGYVGLWVVTVANGQSTITSGDITEYPGAPFISETLSQKISQAFTDGRYALASQVSTAATNLSASVASNALTAALGAATTLFFRNPTITSGAPVSATAPSALSITVPSGATLGTVNGQTARLYFAIAYNGGTPVLCVCNGSIDETALQSPTVISGTSTSANVLYSSSAVSANSPVRVIGFADVPGNTGTAWGSNPTEVQGAGGAALYGMAGIGSGQNYTSFTVGSGGQRVAGTTYYNTTGKPILVHVSANQSATGGFSILPTINGTQLTFGFYGANGNYGWADFVVPIGASYSVTVPSGTIQYWDELR